jgi:hypothetical protein
MNILGIVNVLGAFPVWHTRRMPTPAPTNRYKNYCFPAAILSHAVWLSCRFCLSDRDVEELLFVRGMLVSNEGHGQLQQIPP